MKTLEMALTAHTKKQRWLRIKLHVDVWLQASLYALTLFCLFTGNPFEAFYAHYIALGLYQVISSVTHQRGGMYEKQRAVYDKWMIGHLVAFLPCMLTLWPMFVFTVTSAVLALYYLYITMKEFEN